VAPDIVVSVPAAPEFVPVLRSVVASVAARLDFPYDAIEDLRIAVDEACSQLLAAGVAGATTLRLRITPSSEGVELVASTDARRASWPPAEAERSLAWQVIEALADRAAFEEQDGAPALRIAKLVHPPRGAA
jgi:serine/threonine-protein kinase RsbW